MSQSNSITCKFCNIIIPVGSWISHIQGKKHQRNTPSRILIKGNLEEGKIQEAHDYFAQFGKIQTKDVDIINHEENAVVLHYVFENRVAHSLIAHKQHTLFDNKMTVFWVGNKTIMVDTKLENDENATCNFSPSAGEFETQHNSSTDDSSTSSVLEDDPLSYDELEELLNETETLLYSLGCCSDVDEANTTKKEYSRSRSSSYDRRHRRCRSRSKSVKRRRLRRSCSRSSSIDSRYSRKRHPLQKRSFLEKIRGKLSATQFIHQLGATRVLDTRASNDSNLSGHLTAVTESRIQPLNVNYLSTPDLQEQKQKKKRILLAQCEEVLTAMSNRQVKGLRVLRTPRPKLKKHASPLLKNMAKFKYTSKDATKTSFAETFLKLLHSVGVLQHPNDIKTLVDSVAKDLLSGAIINNTIGVKILQISLLSSKNDVYKECKKMADVGTQCIERRSVGVQTNEDLDLKKLNHKPSYILGSLRPTAENCINDGDKSRLQFEHAKLMCETC